MGKNHNTAQRKLKSKKSSAEADLNYPKASLFWFTVPVLVAFFYVWFYQKYPHNYDKLVPANTSSGGGVETPGRVYDVVEIPGRGKGLTAARDIKQGELVIREKPLLLVPTNLSISVLVDTMDSWSAEQTESLFALTYSRLNTNINLDRATQSFEERLTLTEAIIRNNVVGLAVGLLGLFPNMARMNHACAGAFNMMYHWRSRNEQELRVYAIRDVKKGEELLTVYMDSRQPRDQRIAHLQEAYGFTCTCRICMLPEEESKKSDERLVNMKLLYDKFSTWNLGMISGGEAISLARQIWQLYEEEDYITERGQLAEEAAYVASAHGDELATLSWSRLAYKWASIELGVDSDRAKRSWLVMKNPRKHHAWGSKERIDVGGPIESS